MTVSVIKAAAGIGKTAAAVNALADLNGKLCEIYVPTHQLGEELAQRIKSQYPGMAVKVIYGRSNGPDGKPTCKKHRLADEVAEKGFSVFPSLCSRRGAAKEPNITCEHYEDCSYIAQFRGTAIRIYPHAYLSLERSLLEEQRADFVIIDESFWQTCVGPVRIPISLLRHPELPQQAKAACSAIADAIEQGMLGLGQVVRDAVESGQYAAARQALRRATSIATPEMPAREIRKRLGCVPSFAPVSRLLKQLFVESWLPRPIQSVDYDPKSGVITLHERREIVRFRREGLRAFLRTEKASILILDASANRDIISQFFHVDHYDDISVKRNARIIQCSSTACSTTSLVPEKSSHNKSKLDAKKRLQDIQRLIDSVAVATRGVFMAGPASVVGNPRTAIPPLLTCPANAEFAHFNAIRGIDRWKDCDVAVVIGRNQASSSDVEKLARALYHDHPESLHLPGSLINEVRGYRIEGRMIGVSVQVHPDRRVQGVMEQIREEESRQALDRLRLIHNEQPKTIYLLSNLPLDIDVDELVDWGDLVRGGNRLELAWDRQTCGVLPLASKWMVMAYPDLWSTDEAAKKDVARMRNRGQTPNGISIRETLNKYRPL